MPTPRDYVADGAVMIGCSREERRALMPTPSSAPGHGSSFIPRELAFVRLQMQFRHTISRTINGLA
jgi:hypothetical protein